MSERPSLNDFLLARIAEDEVAIEAAARSIYRASWARMLAECEAKRRIVEEYAETVTVARSQAPDISTEVKHVGAALRAALAHLASVYADHPDYREEWRP